MSVVNVGELRRGLATVINTVAFGKERVTVERHGKPVMALVPLEDLDLLERMEDRALAEKAERILSDPNTEWIPWEQAKAELDVLP